MHVYPEKLVIIGDAIFTLSVVYKNEMQEFSPSSIWTMESADENMTNMTKTVSIKNQICYYALTGRNTLADLTNATAIPATHSVSDWVYGCIHILSELKLDK